ncbi:M48 family metallopeptidase [Pseudomonas sp. 2FG]|uniref:tetratricopeptide repeat protein n=1 Tax=Pseudomonas sp. 2FG TaxID=2502191 RepID=UPI0010F6E3A8|nr:tetratricopeptide repeat protein [Pseudomonas sp. 2FG]
MNKWLIPALAATALLTGCANVPRGAIPVVDSGAPLSADRPAVGGGGVYRPGPAQPQAVPQDSGVVVMVPGAGGSSAPIQTFPATSAPMGGSSGSAPISPGPISTAPLTSGGYTVPAPVLPSGIPAAGGLAADEQLDGPVLALLTTAQQQQSNGDLNGASSSLERAQRIAPREPQVLYRLAQVRLAQGDASQAEQFAQRGLTYANGRPALQASLWGLIAQARERQGNAAGALQARERARVNL